MLCDPPQTRGACEAAQCISEEINSGLALWANSLRVRRLADGALRITWSAPCATPDGEAPARYRVWGRERNESARVLLLQTGDQAFVHTPPGGSHQYEVTSAW